MAELYYLFIFLIVCCKSRTLGARDRVKQNLFGLATFFMPAGLEENRWEDERDCWWTTVFCWPVGGGRGPLWCDWQSHLWANSGKCHPCSFRICHYIVLNIVQCVIVKCYILYNSLLMGICLFLSQSEKNAFFVADLGVIMRQHVRWRTHLPHIRPYYPVRCNSSPTVIEVLAAFGTGFICTNKVLVHVIQ